MFSAKMQIIIRRNFSHSLLKNVTMINICAAQGEVPAWVYEWEDLDRIIAPKRRCVEWVDWYELGNDVA